VGTLINAQLLGLGWDEMATALIDTSPKKSSEGRRLDDEAADVSAETSVREANPLGIGER
jgi:hypothetical protein